VFYLSNCTLQGSEDVEFACACDLPGVDKEQCGAFIVSLNHRLATTCNMSPLACSRTDRRGLYYNCWRKTSDMAWHHVLSTHRSSTRSWARTTLLQDCKLAENAQQVPTRSPLYGNISQSGDPTQFRYLIMREHELPRLTYGQSQPRTRALYTYTYVVFVHSHPVMTTVGPS
jgi:hypothetical protein